jgi:lipopolysaccharide/colanic/teichoic acid biosynthesis glycosyltransferase
MERGITLQSVECSLQDATNRETASEKGIGSDPPMQWALESRDVAVRGTGIKRALDLVLGASLIILLSPVFVVLALLVALEDGWPIIYRRRVVGKAGEFDAYKFRSMRKDGDAILCATPGLKESFEQNFKLKHDPRVTRIGSFIREFSLDELPQLFNVLRGEMSLVGPRMISPVELNKYGPHQRLLLTVKPGLTGYWQVNGRQNVDYDERVKMDLHYINNWSLAMDLKILCKTPYAVLKRDGAY